MPSPNTVCNAAYIDKISNYLGNLNLSRRQLGNWVDAQLANHIYKGGAVGLAGSAATVRNIELSLFRELRYDLSFRWVSTLLPGQARKQAMSQKCAKRLQLIATAILIADPSAFDTP